MFRKLIIIAGTAVLIAMLGLFMVGAVVAEDPEPTLPKPGPWGGAWGRIHRGACLVYDALVELLGMTREEIFAARAEGKTLSQIGNEKGVTDQQMIDAILAAQKERIDQALEAGRITPEQAKWLEEREKAMAPFTLSNPFAPRGRPTGEEGELRSRLRNRLRSRFTGEEGELRGPQRGCWGAAPKVTPTPTGLSSS
jgi:hypothetical protein